MVQAALAQLLIWLSAATTGGRSGRVFTSAKAAAIMFALATLMVCLPGSFQEKKALLIHHFTKVGARLDKLYKAYLVWRQRKCWMWGGGYTPGSVSTAANECMPRGDRMSFDAFIPD